jgi:hypothetical protein
MDTASHGGIEWSREAGAPVANRRPGKQRKKGIRGLARGKKVPPVVIERGKKELEELVDEGKRALQARGQAIRYAEQTGGLIGKVQFADGVQRYVVFKDGQPRACFPTLATVDDLADLPEAIARALPDHDLESIERRAPEEIRRKRPALRRNRGGESLDGPHHEALPPPNNDG